MKIVREHLYEENKEFYFIKSTKSSLYKLKEKFEEAKSEYENRLKNFSKEYRISGSLAEIKFRNSDLGKILSKNLWNARKELMEKVDISNNKVNMPYYIVTLETDDSSDILYSGYDKEEAESSVEDVENTKKYNESSILIQKRNDEFVFVGDKEDNVEDYPLTDDFSREEKWVKTSKENEFEEIKNISIEGSEKSAETLEREIRYWLNKEYDRDKRSF